MAHLRFILSNYRFILSKRSSRKLSYSKFLRVDSYQNFSKDRTKSCFLRFEKYLSSVKCIFDHEKDKNRNFCQARMIVYDLGYFLLGWISSSEDAGREKTGKTSKIQEPFKSIRIELYTEWIFFIPNLVVEEV